MWAKATIEKGSDDYIEVLESLFADTGKPTEINADGEFDNRTTDSLVVGAFPYAISKGEMIWPLLMPP